jgi:hypothetical protein
MEGTFMITYPVNRLRVFENSVIRRIFGLKKSEVIRSRNKDRVISLKKVVTENTNSVYFYPILEEKIVTEAQTLKGKPQWEVAESLTCS